MVKSVTSSTLYFPQKTVHAISEVNQYSLSIVEAPMGYGKTTAVRELLKSHINNLFWQRVFDNSLHSFWEGFCKVIGKIDKKAAYNLLELEFPMDNVSIKVAVSILENIIFPNNSFIIIDDYHIAECNELNNFIDYLIVSETVNVKVVLITRYTYFSRLEELKLKGYIHHVQKDAFELSKSDITGYFKQCGIILKSKEAVELHSFTEGWISAIYLSMLNYKSKGSCFHTNDIYVLMDNVVYSQLQEELKEILLSMSLFNNFTPMLAEFILNKCELVDQIDQLVSRNAFVTYDYSEKTYYMHSILKGFLAEKFNNQSQEWKIAQYQRGAMWYISQRVYFTAMEFAYLAGDFELVLKAIELDSGQHFSREYRDAIIKYYKECPISCKLKYPSSLLVIIRWFFLLNEMDLFKIACDDFMAAYNQLDVVNVEYKNRLMGDFQLALSFTGYNDIEKMSQFHRRASELLLAPSTILSTRNSWTFGAPSVLYLFYRASGQLKDEVEKIKEAMPYYYKITGGHGEGAEYVMEAERFYNIGDFESAEICMHQAIDAAKQEGQSGILICALFLRIRLGLVKGNFSDVNYLFTKMRGDINFIRKYLFIHTIDMCEAFVYAYLGVKEYIPTWIRTGEFENIKVYFPAMGYLNIVYGRALLIQGEYLSLIGLSRKFLGIAAVFPNILAQIYTYIYVGAANYKIFRSNDALDALKQALDLAMPDKVYMPFVENCDYILDIIEELFRQGVWTSEIAIIKELHNQYCSSINTILNQYFIKIKPKLTEREEDIVRLVAEGLSNREIGENLYISPNTVKAQLKTIFDKLGVNSRVLLKQYYKAKE